jgi:hypothetical protein
MSELGMAKEPEISHITEPKNQTPKIEKKKTRPAKPARKPDNSGGSKDSTEPSAKTLQALQKQISRVDETTQEAEKQLKTLDKIQSEVSHLERRLTQVERTSQEILSIVQRIKIKKKKGKNKDKDKKSKK